jgi:hypothetical protein
MILDHPLLLAVALAAATPTVPYPAGYRDWHHVSTTVIQAGHPFYPVLGGINHTYANAPALEGYRSGTFPDGSVLVYDTLEARDADHALTEGGRKMLGVMVKDSTRYAATAGWGFENFEAGDRTRALVGEKATSACLACHSKPGTRDHVYTHLRE